MISITSFDYFHFHCRMNFLNSGIFRRRSPIRVIRWRIANVIESFARDSDDVRLASFERVCSFDVEGKLWIVQLNTVDALYPCRLFTP